MGAAVGYLVGTAVDETVGDLVPDGGRRVEPRSDPGVAIEVREPGER
jgi:hypothetical protein